MLWVQALDPKTSLEEDPGEVGDEQEGCGSSHRAPHVPQGLGTGTGPGPTVATAGSLGLGRQRALGRGAPRGGTGSMARGQTAPGEVALGTVGVLGWVTLGPMAPAGR